MMLLKRCLFWLSIWRTALFGCAYFFASSSSIHGRVLDNDQKYPKCARLLRVNSYAGCAAFTFDYYTFASILSPFERTLLTCHFPRPRLSTGAHIIYPFLAVGFASAAGTVSYIWQRPFRVRLRISEEFFFSFSWISDFITTTNYILALCFCSRAFCDGIVSMNEGLV